MTEPTYKTTNMRKSLDRWTKKVYTRSASESIKADICVACGKPATSFTDELSRREFAISGLCQKCQDIAFAPDEDEEDDGSFSCPDIGIYDEFKDDWIPD